MLRLRVFDIDIVPSSRMLSIVNFLKTNHACDPYVCRYGYRKVNELFSVWFSFVPTFVSTLCVATRQS